MQAAVSRMRTVDVQHWPRPRRAVLAGVAMHVFARRRTQANKRVTDECCSTPCCCLRHKRARLAPAAATAGPRSSDAADGRVPGAGGKPGAGKSVSFTPRGLLSTQPHPRPLSSTPPRCYCCSQQRATQPVRRPPSRQALTRRLWGAQLRRDRSAAASAGRAKQVSTPPCSARAPWLLQWHHALVAGASRRAGRQRVRPQLLAEPLLLPSLGPLQEQEQPCWAVWRARPA